MRFLSGFTKMGFVENYGRTLNFCNNISIVGVSLGHILISGIDQEIARLFKFLYIMKIYMKS